MKKMRKNMMKMTKNNIHENTNLSEKDIGFIDDAIFYIQNAVASQHHAVNTYNQTKKKEYLDVAKYARRRRSKIMERITKAEGEVYCLTKHLLAMAQAARELGDRMNEEGDDTFSKELYEDAGILESVVKLINSEKTEKEVEQ